jgi:T5orf172 domain
MGIGFVYILLNPAFPRMIKIGRTARESRKRASELSRQTGVPDDFLLLYDELVSDTKQVEALLHSRFADYRVKRNKEYFQMPPTAAIKALQEVATRFVVPPKTPVLVADLWPHFQQHFSGFLAPNIKGIRLLQMPATCCLEVSCVSRMSNMTVSKGINIYVPPCRARRFFCSLPSLSRLG